MVSSSRPSEPLKTMAERFLAFISLAIRGAMSLFATPRAVAIGWTGFAKGPRKLKVVGIPRAFLVGPTCLSEGWNNGAKKKVIWVLVKTSASCSGVRSSLIPRASSISEDPVLPLADLEPCLRTGYPQAAMTMAAIEEMFTVPSWSPPVPTISMA